MIGREAERAEIERVLDQLSDGPVGLCFEGAPGIGKSTVWREGVRLAGDRGLRVITTVPSETDRGLAFSGLGDLLSGSVHQSLSLLPSRQQRALSAALLLEDAEPTTDPEALPQAVLGIMRALSAESALVVAIDDEQWLDPASARVLAFALRRMRDEPIAVLLARRPTADSVLWPELERGYGSTGLPAQVLPPLPADALGRLLEERIGRPIVRSLQARIHEVSGGNPFYAVALAGELEPGRDAGSPGAALAIPRSLAEAIGRRLEPLDPRANDPLLVVASTSRPTVALIHAVLSDFTLSDLESAEQAEIVTLTAEAVRFTHPLLAAAHYTRSRPARRREIHRLLAQVLESHEERAYHLARGTEAPDTQIAELIDSAAQAAAGRGAPETGAELFEHAARLTPARSAEAKHDRLLSAAELWRQAGQPTRTRELIEPLLPELHEGETTARALLQLALARTDDSAAAQTLFEQAELHAADDHRLRSRIQICLTEHAGNRGEFDVSQAHALRALNSAELAHDPLLRAQALAVHEGTAFMRGDEVDLDRLLQATTVEDDTRLATSESPTCALAQILLWSDDYEAAREAHDRVIRLARERGQLSTTAFYLLELAFLEWFAGNRQLAASYQRESEQLVRGQEFGLDIALDWTEAIFASERGEFEAARTRALAALELAEGAGDLLFVGGLAMVVARVDLWTGQAASAHRRLQPLRETFTSAGLRFLCEVTLDMWAIDIEALLACGRLDEADAVAHDLLDRARACPNPNALAIAERCRGLVLGARGEIGLAIEALENALDAHARRPLAPQLARTLLELGTLQRRAKKKTAAKQNLKRALDMFGSIGAPMWQERARDELARVGLRRPVPTEGLTPTQQRVAELVAAGMSNREIATTLFMSTRSVESHLTKTYRELGIRSRAQLAAALAATGPTNGAQATGYVARPR